MMVRISLIAALTTGLIACDEDKPTPVKAEQSNGNVVTATISESENAAIDAAIAEQQPTAQSEQPQPTPSEKPILPVAPLVKDTPPTTMRTTGTRPAGAGKPTSNISANDIRNATLVAYNEQAYQAPNGASMFDVIEGSLGFIELGLYFADGEGIPNQQFKITSRFNNPIVGRLRLTDDTGGVKIVVRPKKAGLDVITAEWGNRKVQIRVNVLTKEAKKWAGFDDQDGLLRWETLLKTNVMYSPTGKHTINFTPEIKPYQGKKVTLAGFMMPLETTDTHKQFLLVSSPPSCFFHTPGGAAGSVEINMGTALPMTYDPIIVSGKFELITNPEEGLVYRLQDVQLVPRK